MPERILMIDDDTALAGMVAEYLGRHGIVVTIAATLSSGSQRLRDEAFDGLILDGMLPDGDGLDLCRQLRERSALPILMLTARGEEVDRIVGLELGADDYLPKPFSPRELLARLRALLRRAHGGGPTLKAELLRFGRLEIDHAARQARIDGEPAALTSHQFELLWALATHPGRVLSREVLLELARGDTLEAFDRSIDVHISRIRAAIEDDSRHPNRIITVRGAGYVFARHPGDGAA